MKANVRVPTLPDLGLLRATAAAPLPSSGAELSQGTSHCRTAGKGSSWDTGLYVLLIATVLGCYFMVISKVKCEEIWKINFLLQPPLSLSPNQIKVWRREGVTTNSLSYFKPEMMGAKVRYHGSFWLSALPDQAVLSFVGRQGGIFRCHFRETSGLFPVTYHQDWREGQQLKA